jgi:uncharacterized damage-inducible protein DinB
MRGDFMFGKELLTKEIEASLEFLERATRPLAEADSNFTPQPGLMTTAQQLAHVASTVHWLLDGAFSPEGFDMNFEAHTEAVKKVTSLEIARRLVRDAYARVLKALNERPESDWTTQIVPGPIMGGEPRLSALLGVIEHTAHHRGVLSTYTRLSGKIPLMPYMEMPQS